ncbi:MAG: VOC family protein [Chitinophagaceae bacterium]
MPQSYITGIQQIGIGVCNALEAANFYKVLFGMNVLVFDDSSEAKLMTRYTGNTVYNRRALLTLNLQGGGGFEVWQFLNRTPKAQNPPSRFGDLGINAAIIKCADINEAHKHLSKQSAISLSEINVLEGLNEASFWVTDNTGHRFLVKQYGEQFNGLKCATGGVLGAVIGVSDLQKSLPFYQEILGLNLVLNDRTEEVEDANEPEGKLKVRRVLLEKQSDGRGAFGKLLGSVQVELVQRMDGTGKHIYQDRFWGDPGFIHLCFDVLNMDGLKAHAAASGFHFTIDSQNSFAMEKAAGRFCYVEDPDGTLIELVETHRVPILKSLNLHLNLKKRGLEKPLPDWMVKMLGFSKLKG